MALMTAQLLFVERREPGVVVLDLVVLARADAAASPPVGAPLAFALSLPGDTDEQTWAAAVLESWTTRSAIVELDVRTRRGRDQVVLRASTVVLVLHPRVTQDAP